MGDLAGESNAKGAEARFRPAPEALIPRPCDPFRCATAAVSGEHASPARRRELRHCRWMVLKIQPRLAEVGGRSTGRLPRTAPRARTPLYIACRWPRQAIGLPMPAQPVSPFGSRCTGTTSRRVRSISQSWTFSGNQIVFIPTQQPPKPKSGCRLRRLTSRASREKYNI